MALITLSDAQLAYGHVPLLAHTALSLEAAERVALIGRNGTGKSSLLKVLAGLEKLDDGVMQQQQGLRRYYVAQEPLFSPGVSVFDAVSEGVAEARDLRARFEAHSPDEDLDAIQTRIEALDGWTWEQRVDEALQRLDLAPDGLVERLSGGQKKRVALAQALVARPDVLLLDEPTNHLDMDAIDWLQQLLTGWRGALVVISHDRAFIDGVATRIVELDRGLLRSYPGNFSAFERFKAQELEAEALANARADKLLAQEEVWVRKGVEARRTRSVGRIGRLQKLRAERSARRDRVGQVRLELDAGQPPGKIVAELSDVGLSFAGANADGSDKLIVQGFTSTILRGDKIGLVGPNGVGKTTLLKLILGELEPDRGRVRRGTQLQVAYFDQMRAGLNLDATLVDSISPGSEWIELAGGRKHVMSYLTDFLFSPERANSPVRTLSGGERNRVLLARLFALPANVLVLDEPTNDLDIDTLELLEELLQTYPGTVFLVSHDRRFLDNVVTSLIAWEGDLHPGRWREYEGGIADWRLQRARMLAAQAEGRSPARTEAAATAASRAPSKVAPAAPSDALSDAPDGAVSAAPSPAAAAAPAPAAKVRKLSYKDQRELDALPARIAALEAEQKTLAERLASNTLYTEAPDQVPALQARYAAIDDELLAALERWETLG